MDNNGSTFGASTFITFPVVGSSGVSHPHETLQLDNELLVPDLVSPLLLETVHGNEWLSFSGR